MNPQPWAPTVGRPQLDALVLRNSALWYGATLWYLNTVNSGINSSIRFAAFLASFIRPRKPRFATVSRCPIA